MDINMYLIALNLINLRLSTYYEKVDDITMYGRTPKLCVECTLHGRRLLFSFFVWGKTKICDLCTGVK